MKMDPKKMCIRDRAEKLGISYQYLSRIECGKQSPSFFLLVQLADALDVDAAELVSGKEERPF